MKATSIKQSNKLLNIGVSPGTADMYYEEYLNSEKLVVGDFQLHQQCMEDRDYRKHSNKLICPAWSSYALSDIISKACSLMVLYNRTSKIWTVSISNESDFLNTVRGKDLVHQLIRTIEWMIKNKILTVW